MRRNSLRLVSAWIITLAASCMFAILTGMTTTGSSLPETKTLEAMQRKRFELGNILLNLDMYERWGHGSDPAMNLELEKMGVYSAEAEQLEKQITEKVKSLPLEIRKDWAAAHIRLLESFIAKKNADPEKYSTELFVAKEEMDSWHNLAQGKINYVSRNVFYVSYDREEYFSLFGFFP
ncbi:MAG: hypothetical protein LDLANPLL_00435 [Turneriella sp.]|nr:hypothetical protein [Turneriella sp.]